jgi:hypothetical protein
MKNQLFPEEETSVVEDVEAIAESKKAKIKNNIF